MVATWTPALLRRSALALAVLATLHFSIRAGIALDRTRHIGCVRATGHAPVDVATRPEIAIWPQDRCVETPLTVVSRVRYRVRLAMPRPCAARELERDAGTRHTGQWADGLQPAGAPPSVSTRDALRAGPRGLVSLLALPFRESLASPWLAITLNLPDGESVPLTDLAVTLEASRTGPLTVRVNDAVLPGTSWRGAYANNAGGPARLRLDPAMDRDGMGEPLPSLTCDEQAEQWVLRAGPGTDAGSAARAVHRLVNR